MSDTITDTLKEIKEITGIERVLLMQNDGLPVSFAGIWPSKEEFFVIASVTYNLNHAARSIACEYDYLLLETAKSNLLLMPMPNVPVYILGITTAPRVNVAALINELKDSVAVLSEHLHLHLHPSVRNEYSHASNLESYVIPLTKTTLDRLNALSIRASLHQIKRTTPKITAVFLSSKIGCRFSLEEILFDIFDQSKKLMRTLSRGELVSVSIETCTTSHFIYEVPYGVLDLEAKKDN